MSPLINLKVCTLMDIILTKKDLFKSTNKHEEQEVHVFRLNGGNWIHIKQILYRFRKNNPHFEYVEAIMPGNSIAFHAMNESLASWDPLDLSLHQRCLILNVPRLDVEKIKMIILNSVNNNNGNQCAGSSFDEDLQVLLLEESHNIRIQHLIHLSGSKSKIIWNSNWSNESLSLLIQMKLSISPISGWVGIQQEDDACIHLLKLPVPLTGASKADIPSLLMNIASKKTEGKDEYIISLINPSIRRLTLCSKLVERKNEMIDEFESIDQPYYYDLISLQPCIVERLYVDLALTRTEQELLYRAITSTENSKSNIVYERRAKNVNEIQMIYEERYGIFLDPNHLQQYADCRRVVIDPCGGKVMQLSGTNQKNILECIPMQLLMTAPLPISPKNDPQIACAIFKQDFQRCFEHSIYDIHFQSQMQVRLIPSRNLLSNSKASLISSLLSSSSATDSIPELFFIPRSQQSQCGLSTGSTLKISNKLFNDQMKGMPLLQKKPAASLTSVFVASTNDPNNIANETSKKRVAEKVEKDDLAQGLKLLEQATNKKVYEMEEPEKKIAKKIPSQPKPSASEKAQPKKLEDMSLPELKELCKEHGLTIKGKKQELIDKLLPVLAQKNDKLI